MSEPALIRLEGVSRTYRMGHEDLVVLDAVNLTMEKGLVYSVTGKSGSGKSTLLNLIGGLDGPSAGVIEVGGWKVSHLDEDQMTRYRTSFIGFVFQFHYLMKDFSALENVMLPAYIAGKKRSEATARAKLLLEEVGLGERLQHLPSELSGGERQRVAIARALVNEPELLLADEPTGNLDRENAAKVEEILIRLVKNLGKTLIIVTHDAALAARGERIFRLENGSVIGDGSAESDSAAEPTSGEPA